MPPPSRGSFFKSSRMTLNNFGMRREEEVESVMPAGCFACMRVIDEGEGQVWKKSIRQFANHVIYELHVHYVYGTFPFC